MDKIIELNSCRRLRKAESVLSETQIKEKVEYFLNNNKSFSNIVQCDVLFKTVMKKSSQSKI